MIRTQIELPISGPAPWFDGPRNGSIMRRSAVTLFLSLSVLPWSSGTEEIAVLHVDLRTGRNILVSGETPPDKAAAWLAEISMAADNAAEDIHKKYAENGLKPHDADVLLARETVITQYSEGFGGTIWVIGGTPLSSAAAWMRAVREAKSHGPLQALVRENHGNGLLACTINSAGTKSTVAWGTIVGKSEQKAEEGTPPKFDKLGEWLAAINAAKTEKDLVDVVRANHAEGLSTASGLRVSEGDIHMGVSVVWVNRGLLGRSKN